MTLDEMKELAAIRKLSKEHVVREQLASFVRRALSYIPAGGIGYSETLKREVLDELD